jgi:hypothetical protein
VGGRRGAARAAGAAERRWAPPRPQPRARALHCAGHSGRSTITITTSRRSSSGGGDAWDGRAARGRAVGLPNPGRGMRWGPALRGAGAVRCVALCFVWPTGDGMDGLMGMDGWVDG